MGKKYSTIFIDEVQRLPSILNTLQAMMDDRLSEAKFYLTGSSARKLRRGKANLLPGRIHTYQLGPFSSAELGYRAEVQEILATGVLPSIYLDKSIEEKIKSLRSYTTTYLKEEVQAEALTRNMEGFSRLLFVAAHYSGHFLDFNKLASEAQIPRQSAIRYFEILEDTLLVNRCESFAKSGRKRLVQHPKFYFFDNGVLNALLGNFEPSPDRKGLLFEHLFFNQLLAGAFNRDRDIRISTYRTEHGAEVDFVVESKGEVWAVELKASRDVGKNDLRGLKGFGEFHGKPHHPLVAYLGTTDKIMEGIPIMPWQKALKAMGL